MTELQKGARLWQVGGLRALEDAIDLLHEALVQLGEARAVRHQAARLYQRGELADCGQTLAQGELGHATPVGEGTMSVNISRPSRRWPAADASMAS